MRGVGRAAYTPNHLLLPGEYCQTSHDGEKYYIACTPDGRLANLSKHTIVEHPDGTITVSPSILVTGGGNDGSWHGYLDRGVWREC
jgi:hypothetical protein